MVAVVQLAITLGVAGGGLLFDFGGYRATFVASAACSAPRPLSVYWTCAAFSMTGRCSPALLPDTDSRLCRWAQRWIEVGR